MGERYEQPMLNVPIRPGREVGWYNVQEVERRKLFGKKIVTACTTFSRTVIEADKIGELTDPDLRYALRLADAVAAVGWVEYCDGGSYKDTVSVDATDEGMESRLIGAFYSGVIDAEGHDSFMDGILRDAPIPHENY